MATQVTRYLSNDGKEYSTLQAAQDADTADRNAYIAEYVVDKLNTDNAGLVTLFSQISGTQAGIVNIMVNDISLSLANHLDDWNTLITQIGTWQTAAGTEYDNAHQ
jgi:hypothetical protein